MKNLIKVSLLFCLMLSISSAFAGASSPCPTGVNKVKSHWFGPFNDTTFTMCGCQIESGISASGGCTANPGGDPGPIGTGGNGNS